MPSAYLIETAKENIEGKITIDEVKSRAKLKSLGILLREGADKNGYWKINNFDGEK
jgi:hypothetical protein